MKYVALLRGINVGGHRRVPMAELRRIAESEGFTGVRTYVASGNLVLGGEGPARRIEAVLEAALERRFGFAVDVVVRSSGQWADYLASHPFGAAGERAPNLVMLCIGKQAANEDHVEKLRARASGNERVALRGDAIWLFFADGAGRSRLGPGPPAGVWTTRNLRTVQAISKLLD